MNVCDRRSSALVRPSVHVLALVATLFAVTANAELPSVKLVTAPLVTPTNAWAQYTTSASHTSGVAAWTATTRPPEIKELARALGAGRYSSVGYANAVYEYVRNNIAVEFRFGLSKGARGAIIDQSGTAFDQAHLMAELLLEGGVTSVNYQVGTIALTAAQFQSWTGLADPATGLISQLAACQFLADGGIPATINGATTCSGLTGALPTSGNVIVMGHIWVLANGKLYDPVYKVHVIKAGVDLASSMGCGTASAPTCGTQVLTNVPTVQPGTGGVPYVQSVNQTGLESTLSLFATTLLNSIRTTNTTNRSTSNPNMQVEDLVGGASIDANQVLPDPIVTNQISPLAASAYSAVASYLWNANIGFGIPDQFRTTMLVQIDNLNGGAGQLVYADEIYGNRMRIWGLTGIVPGARSLSLYVEYKPIATSVLPGATSANTTLTLTVNHPYAAGSMTYQDEVLASSLPIQGDGLVAPACDGCVDVVTIVQSWGATTESTVSHFSALAARDASNTTPENPSDPKHIWVNRVVGYQYDACEHAPAVPTAPVSDPGCYEHHQSSVAASWGAQASRVLTVTSQINSVVSQLHHSIGFVVGGKASRWTRFSVQSSLSLTGRVATATSAAADRNAAFASVAASLSQLEGGVLEQNFGRSGSGGGSSVAMIVKANSLGTRLLEVTNANQAAAVSQLTNYPTDIQTLIGSYATAQYALIVPQNGRTGGFSFISGGCPVGNCLTYLYSGIAGFGSALDRVAYLSAGIYKGAGASVANPSIGVANSIKTVDYSLKGRQRFGVNPADGSLNIVPTPDLVTGTGEFPHSLPFQRSFSPSNMGWTDSATFVGWRSYGGGRPLNEHYDFEKLQTAGWTHNYVISATFGSDGMAGLGTGGALDAASAIAALYVQRTLNTTTSPDIRTRLATIFTTHWFGNQLVDNIVTVKRPPRVDTFTKLADQSINSPPGSAERLVQTGAPVPSFYGDFGEILYNYNSVAFTLTGVEGSVLAFTNGNTVQSLNKNFFVPTTWTFRDGVILTFAYAPNAVNATVLTSVSNNLGRSLTFNATSTQLVRDESNRAVTYAVVPQAPTYAGTAENFFPATVSFTGPDGGVTTYNYTTKPTAPVAISRQYSRIASWTTPSGGAPYVSVSFDSFYRVKSLTDNSVAPNTTNYFISGLYDRENRKRSEIMEPLDVFPANPLTTKYFDRFGSEIQSWDALGRVSTSVYDTYQRKFQVVYPEGNSIAYRYDMRHNVLTETVAAKPSSALPSWVTTKTYPEGPTVTNCVTSATCNKVATETDPKGNVTTYSYNSQFGFLTRSVGAATLAPQTDYCYAPQAPANVQMLVGKISKVSASVNRVVSFSYNSANRYVLAATTIDPGTTYVVPATPTSGLCSTTTKASPLALATLYSFDSIGNVQTIDGPRAGTSDTTTYTFDQRRRLTTISAPLATLTRHCYDADGLLVSTNRRINAVSDPNVLTATTNGQCPNAFLASDWQSDKNAYYPTGALLSTTDAKNSQTIYAYDAVGRQRVVSDPLGRQTATVYDAAGQVVAAWRGGANWLAGSGVSTTPSVNAPVASTGWVPSSYTGTGAIRYASYGYSLNGKQLSTLDANNNQTDFQYDKHDRLWFTFFPDPSSGTRCTQNTTEMTSATVPAPTCTGGQTFERLWYTANGQAGGTKCSGILDTICRKRTRNDQTIASTYDVLNRHRTKAPSGQGTVTYSYNLVDELTSVSEPASGSFAANNTAYSYDSAGRKLTEVNTSSGTARTVSFQYDTLASARDNAGQRTRTTWPDGYFVTYEYDALNRMQRVRENSASAGEIAYYTYDALSRRTNLCFAGTSATCTTTSANKVGYTYEADSNIDVVSHALGAASVSLDHGYNLAGQINGIVANDAFYLPQPAVASAPVYVADKLNRYATIAALAPTYDSNGNMLTWYPDNTTGSRQTLTYDSENRLITAAVNNSGAATISYDYDALGRRQRKTVSGTVTQFLLDDDEEIAEYSGATLLRRYIVGPGIDDRIARAEGSGTTNPTKYYFHSNHQGSVIASTDSTGSAACASCMRISYDEYGNSAAAITGEQYRYTGRRFDAETGLYYYRARYYAPQIGRFLQTDPIGYGDDLNLYAYTRSDPLNNVDPTGAVIETVWDVANVAMDVASLGANIASGNVGGALLDAGGLIVDAAATVIPGVPGGAGAAIKAARGVDAARSAATARGRASEARKLAEIGATKNTTKTATSTGDRIRDGTKADGTHVEVKDKKRVDNTEQLRGLDEAAGKDGKRLEVHTGTNTDVSRNVNSQTLPNTDVIRCPTLGPSCK